MQQLFNSCTALSRPSLDMLAQKPSSEMMLRWKVICPLDKQLCPGARFSKVPKRFRVHVVWQIDFVSSKLWRPEARNFVDILILIPFTTYEKNQHYRNSGSEFKKWLFGHERFLGLSRNGPRVYIFVLATHNIHYFLVCKLRAKFTHVSHSPT